MTTTTQLLLAEPSSKTTMTNNVSKWDIVPVQPGELYDDHHLSEYETTMSEYVSEQLLKLISRVALVTGFVVKFSKATFHAVIPSIVRLLYRYNKWATNNRPLLQLINYLYNLRTEDYWVYKTPTGRLKGLDGSFHSKKK